MNSSPDRFTESPMSAGRVDRDEDGYPEPAWQYPLECQNCGQTAERLTQSPDDDNFRICDACMEEAVRINTRETAELLARAGCSIAESACYLAVLEPIKIQVARASVPEWKEIA